MTFERPIDFYPAITAHLSEMRLQLMLDDYWERYGARCPQWFYWPSCPEVNAEN